MDKPTARLKSIIARREAVVMPGTANALFARVIEHLGFEAAYVTGAGVANMELGLPDIGLTSVTEMSEAVARIADAISIPVLADGDTGFGNPVNMRRTVRLYERAGAAGIQIEDQVFPKKCGHFAGKGVIPLAEMVAKIRAAVDARQDGDFQIVARTDARAVNGIDDALDRGHAFVEAGADVIFIEAPISAEEMGRIAREIEAPKLINIVHGGLTPALPHARFRDMGFSIALYANAVLQASLHAVENVLGVLKTDGSLHRAQDALASFEARQRSVDKGFYDELERRYAVDLVGPPAAIKRIAS